MAVTLAQDSMRSPVGRPSETHKHIDEMSLLRWQRVEAQEEPYSSRRIGEWIIHLFMTHSRVSKLSLNSVPPSPSSSASPSQAQQLCSTNNVDHQFFNNNNMARGHRNNSSKPQRAKAKSDLQNIPSSKPKAAHAAQTASALAKRQRSAAPKTESQDTAKPTAHSTKPADRPTFENITFHKNGANIRVLSFRVGSNPALSGTGKPLPTKFTSPRLPPRRRVQGPDLPRAHLLALPQEIRDDILDPVFDSALIIMSTVEYFCSNRLRSLTTCRSPYDFNGIPKEVFPCMTEPYSQDFYPSLPDRLWNERLRFRHLPYARARQVAEARNRKIVDCERHEQESYGPQAMFTNRQLAFELAPTLYGRTVFVFGSSVALRNFLNVQDKLADRYRQRWPKIVQESDLLALRNKQSMSSFCLEIRHYGEMEEAKLRPFVFRYYMSWKRACRQLVDEAPNLTNVSLNVVVPPGRTALSANSACQLDLNAAWVAPILEFGRAKYLRGASVTLLLNRSLANAGATEDTCIAFSEVLRRKMVGFDDESAKEALRFFKSQPWKDPRTTVDDWKAVGKANGIELMEEERS